jgi:hypothetical protein
MKKDDVKEEKDLPTSRQKALVKSAIASLEVAVKELPSSRGKGRRKFTSPLGKGLPSSRGKGYAKKESSKK